MPRTLLGCAVLAALALPCRAGQATPAPEETLIRLVVSPAPAPRPALRYQLLPEFRELSPGNPCFNYLQCFMGHESFFFGTEAVRRREALLAMPLEGLPARELLDYGGAALTRADWAARLDAPDWQATLRLRLDGPATVFSDVQQLRFLASALKVRLRAEVALGRFDDAVRTAKTMFAMARHLGEHPALVGNLQGFNLATLVLGPLEEMLERPGCPNLYWALTNLPDPLVPIDKGVGGERDLFLGLFRELSDEAPMSQDQLKRLLESLDASCLRGTPVRPGAVRGWLDRRIEGEGAVEAARRHLVEYGLPEGRLQTFPADQVILLDERRKYEVCRDDILKLMSLPLRQALPQTARFVPPGDDHPLFVEPLVAGLLSINRPRARLEQRIALLRHVEALRLFAGEHDGTLPATLAGFSVPLPDDPVTGEPFRYEVDGVTAHFRNSPPPGEEKNPACNFHYAVTVRK